MDGTGGVKIKMEKESVDATTQGVSNISLQDPSPEAGVQFLVDEKSQRKKKNQPPALNLSEMGMEAGGMKISPVGTDFTFRLVHELFVRAWLSIALFCVFFDRLLFCLSVFTHRYMLF